jgi:hypothetical protein
MEKLSVQAAVRALLGGAVGRLPPPVADAIRQAPPPGRPPLPASVRRAVLRALREGGIPRTVSTFRLADNPELAFVAADSLVLAQLYWCGEAGCDPSCCPGGGTSAGAPVPCWSWARTWGTSACRPA